MEQDLAVTLLVKAANQRYGDHAVNCFLNWNIGKLKHHISESYPSKPETHHQKLIYSGKLLQDDQLLQDVLYKVEGAEEDERPHTVHLVCAAAVEARFARDQAESSSSSDGLRHRVPSAEATTESTSPTPAATDLQQQYMQQWQAAARMNPQMAQMMYYQQAYMQQWNQYMMMYQQGIAAPVATEAAEVQPRRPLNQNVQMNAGAGAGGEELLDDDQDERPRDWLDWVYTLMRVMLLANVIYFYSSFSRFALVAVSFVLFYLIQGRVRLYRQRAHQRQVEERQAEAEARHDAEADEEQNNNGPEAELGEPEPPQPVSIGARLQRVVDTSATFFVTFFTSLLPEPPVQA